MVELYTLGTPDLRTGEGGAVQSLLRGPKRFGLLAYLAVARPRGFHRRETLLAYFWPESDAARARGALRALLHEIRSEVGDSLLQSRGREELAVAPDELWCDAVRFEDALEEGRPREAMELYRGHLLEGFFPPGAAPAFDHWLDVERERLRLRAVSACWSLAYRTADSGDDEGAAYWGRRAVSLAPLDEAGVRRLMELLASAANRAGALEAYRNLEERLGAEFQMTPSGETRVLAETLREGDEPDPGAPPSRHQPREPGPDDADVRSGASPSPDARHHYLQGRHFWRQRTEDALRKAVEAFRAAAAADPGYARAHAGLADTYLALGAPSLGWASPRDALARAREAAERALELDPHLGEAHVSLGVHRLYHGDWSGAEVRLRRGIDLDPELAEAREKYGWLLALRGEFDEAVRELWRAVELDPLSLSARTAIGRVYHFMRRPDDAIREYEAVLDLEPRYMGALMALAVALIQKGEAADAVAVARRLQEVGGSNRPLPILVYSLAMAGEEGEARRLLDELLSDPEAGDPPPGPVGFIHVGLGEHDRALDWFEKVPTPGLFSPVEPLLDPLRSYPRFHRVMSRPELGPKPRHGSPSDGAPAPGKPSDLPSSSTSAPASGSDRE